MTVFVKPPGGKAMADALARSHLYYFCLRVFAELEPSEIFLDNWHVEALCHALEQALAGKTNRLIITMPPRHLKSTIVNVALTAFLLGRNPSEKIMSVSYGLDLSTKFSIDVRRVMESAWYQAMFPATILTKTAELRLETSANGHRMATSVHGSVTGFGGNILIVDDPNKANEGEVQRQSTNDWYSSTLSTRLNQPEKGLIIVVQQRLYEDDLAGHLLETGLWTHLNLPAIAEEKQVIPLGANRVHVRMPGDVLHPARMSAETLASKKVEMGSVNFAAQYQQRPAAVGDEYIQWNWFGRFDQEEIAADQIGDRVIVSIDLALTLEDRSDYTVFMAFLLRDDKLYLFDVIRKKYDAPMLLKQIPRFASLYKADKVVVEAAGTSLPICQLLERQNGEQYFFYRPMESKKVRLAAYAHLVEQGRVLLPHTANWLLAFKQEIDSFPNGRHDDQVDAFAQALHWFNHHRNPPQSRVTLCGEPRRLVDFSRSPYMRARMSTPDGR